VQTALCAGTRCEVDECCSARATCDEDACGDTHVLRDAGDPQRVALCETNVCTPDECCEPKDQCDVLVCDAESTLKPSEGEGAYPPLCALAECTSSECCETCPFEGCWQSTAVFGGLLTIQNSLSENIVGDCESGWSVEIAGAPVGFCFTVERGCRAAIHLDALTVAEGELIVAEDLSVSWDMILNSDVWEERAMSECDAANARRLDADAVRKYELKDFGITPVSPERRLTVQDVRMDFEIETGSSADALEVKGLLQALTMEEIEDALHLALEDVANFSIGSVYRWPVDELETQQEVIPGTRTSGAMSARFWTWMPALAVFAAAFVM